MADVSRVVAVALRCDGNPSGCEAVPTGCPAGDTNGDECIEVTDLLAAVSALLLNEAACPLASPGIVGCGNGIVEGDEECNDGGNCIGTSGVG